MKIIIIGAGISGLATAISLRKYLSPKLNEPLDVKIYDESEIKSTGTVEHGWKDHSDIRQKSQGAAISLQKNAFKVLRELDPNLADRVYAAGLLCNGFTWKTASDWMLGHEYLDAHLISRPLLINCLQRSLPRGSIVYRTVSGVAIKEGGSPTIFFSDGGKETADLIVGADGIRSPVRKALFGTGAEYQPQYL